MRVYGPLLTVRFEQNSSSKAQHWFYHLPNNNKNLHRDRLAPEDSYSTPGLVLLMSVGTNLSTIGDRQGHLWIWPTGCLDNPIVA